MRFGVEFKREMVKSIRRPSKGKPLKHTTSTTFNHQNPLQFFITHNTMIFSVSDGREKAALFLTMHTVYTEMQGKVLKYNY